MVFAPRARLGLVDQSSQNKVLLAVAHSTVRGTKRAVDDAIYKAGASNLSSVHKDFEELGVAYDLSVIDRALTEDEVHGLVATASEVTGDDNAIRSVRQFGCESELSVLDARLSYSSTESEGADST